MNDSILFIVSSDPRRSGRPAEAIRIAAGVGSWGGLDVRVYLEGPATAVLHEWPDECIDDDNFQRCLPILAGLGEPIYVDASAPEVENSPWAHQRIGRVELAELAARSKYVARF